MSESTVLFPMLNKEIEHVATHVANVHWGSVGQNESQSLLDNANSFSDLAFRADVDECQALNLVAYCLQAALRLGKWQIHSTSRVCHNSPLIKYLRSGLQPNR